MMARQNKISMIMLGFMMYNQLTYRKNKGI